MLSLIVAMAENRVIGVNNNLPWRLPNDLRYFKQVTMGKPVIMGRKTFESIGKPLPGRTNIVITRQSDYKGEGVDVVSSLDEAIALGRNIGLINGIDEVMVIGGAEIYAQALPYADRLYLTQVHARIEGDAYFPEIAWDEFSEVGREDFQAEGANPYDYSFVVYEAIDEE